MNVIFDNIIFFLQRSGGGTVYWIELINRLLNDSEFAPSFIDFQTQNIFSENLSIPKSMILENPRSIYPLFVQRYLNPRIEVKGISHSSYYRYYKGNGLRNILTIHDFCYSNLNKINFSVLRFVCLY